MEWEYIKIQTNRRKYQLVTGMLESDKGELGFCQSLRRINWILFAFKDIRSGNVSRFRQTHIPLTTHKWFTRL